MTKPTCKHGEHLDEPRRLYDARGLYVATVCDRCEATVRAKYRPEIFTNGSYECDEPIEPEDY